MADNLDKITKAFLDNKAGTAKSKKSSTKKSNSSNGKNYWGKNYYKNPDLVNANAKKAVNKSVNKSLDTVIASGLSNQTSSSSANSVVQKEIRKLPIISKICIIILFLVGVAISIGVCFLVCSNDQFEIIGKKNITLNVFDDYSDLGVKAIGFRCDMTNQVTIEVYKDGKKLEGGLDAIDTTTECVYQIVYKLNNFRFRDAQIIRTVNVIVPLEEKPEDSYNPDNNPTNPDSETNEVNEFKKNDLMRIYNFIN